MESETDLKQAFKETYVVLNTLDRKSLNKIPIDLINLIKNNMDTEYNFKVDYSKNLTEQDFSNTTLGIISIIYSKYLCSEEEKKKWETYDNFVLEKQEELKSKIFPKDNLFDKTINIEKIENSSNSISNEKNKIVEYKQNPFTKLINKIKAFLFKTK